MNGKPIPVAVAGAGRMGQVHCRIVSDNPRATLTAVVDPFEEIGRGVAEQFGSTWYPTLADARAATELTAVVIAVPDKLHVGVTVEALEAHLHVLVEKPLADTYEGAVTIAQAAKKSKSKVLVGHVLRHDPRFRSAAAAVAAGKVGKPVHLRASRIVPRSVGVANRGASPIYMYQGIHDIDLVQWISGSPIVRVCAATSAKILPALGVEGVDVALVLFELADGSIGSLEISWALLDNSPSGLASQFEIYGTEGALRVDVTDEGFAVSTEAGYALPNVFLSADLDGRLDGVVPQQFDHFLHMIDFDVPSRIGIEEAVAAARVLDAIESSLSSGGWADVKP
jgi:myo-inositol 2-dehydrogenase/D-chiro-inositol 1-dehydrogenase